MDALSKNAMCRRPLIVMLDPVTNLLGSTMKMGAEMVMLFFAGGALRK